MATASGNGSHGDQPWSRRKRMTVGLTVGVGGGLAVIGLFAGAPKTVPAKPAAVASSAPAAPAPHKTTAAVKPVPVVTHTATAKPKPVPVVTHTAKPAPARPAVAAGPSAMGTWCAGPGATYLTAVKADVTELGIDAGNYDVAAVITDGATLQVDATDAGLNPPPVTGGQQANYRQAMASYMTAGGAAAAGDFSGAAAALTTGNGYITQDAGILPDGCTG